MSNWVQRRRDYRAEQDATWRAAEYVVAYADWGDRGRMRGSSCAPDGVLHRPSCRTLSAERREWAENPANVYSTTLDDFRREADTDGLANAYRTCRICCKDIAIVGCNVRTLVEV